MLAPPAGSQSHRRSTCWGGQTLSVVRRGAVPFALWGVGMSHTPVGIGVARRIGDHSDGILVSPGLRWFVTSGTPGLPQVGSTPSGVTAQAEVAWTHIIEALSAAQMRAVDVVRVTEYLTNRDDIGAYSAVRLRYLGNHRPASMLLVVDQLVRPEFLVAVEVIAARG